MNKKSRIAVRIVLFLVVAYLGLSHYFADAARARLDASITQRWPPNTFVYKDVSYSLFTRQTVISDISILPPATMTTVHIDKVVVRRMADDPPTPSILAVDIQGMTLDPAVFGGAAAARCAALGYAGPLICDMGIDYTYAKEKRELAVHNVFLSVKDVGAVRLAFTINNTDFDLNQAASGLLTLNPQMRLQGAELVYADASLVERVLKEEAAKKGVDVAALKKSLAADAGAALQPETSPILTSVVAALKQFIENPRQLSISATPATPVSLGEIGSAGSPEAVAKLLNLQVKS